MNIEECDFRRVQLQISRYVRMMMEGEGDTTTQKWASKSAVKTQWYFMAEPLYIRRFKGIHTEYI